MIKAPKVYFSEFDMRKVMRTTVVHVTGSGAGYTTYPEHITFIRVFMIPESTDHGQLQCISIFNYTKTHNDLKLKTSHSWGSYLVYTVYDMR